MHIIPVSPWHIPEGGSHVLPCNLVSEHVVQFSEKAKQLGKPDGNASRPSADPPTGTRLPAIGLSTIIVHQLLQKKKKKDTTTHNQEQRLFRDYVFPKLTPCYLVHHGLAVLPEKNSPICTGTHCSKTTGLLQVPHVTG